MRAVLLALLVCVAFAGDHLSPLDEAPPKAAARKNPFDGKEDAVRAGRKLYARECAACHGKQGEGIGKRPPLASPEAGSAPAGAVEWVVRNGSLRGGMPSFSHIPEAQRWQIVTYLKTLSRAK